MAASKKPLSGTTTLHIRNMVCNRCIKVVREELEKLKLDVRSIALGEAVVGGEVRPAEREKIKRALEQNGFELIEDRRIKTIERIKHAILKLIYSEQFETEFSGKYSEYLSRELGQDNHALSKLFSTMEGVTVEQYIILQNIDRV
ncbi:MAG: heavy-metal-associated domain-containing protein, partial [Bacteroidota bacterium]